jgi:hypothetical protein
MSPVRGLPFSIGSQNFYPSTPATLSELTYVVEDASLASTLYESYFRKMESWALPAAGAQPKVDQSIYVIRLHRLTCLTVSDSGWGQTAPDQCFLTRSGSKIWPNTTYVKMSPGAEVKLRQLRLGSVGHLDNTLTVKLWEWDWFSDNLLGHFDFHPDHPIPLWFPGVGPGDRKLGELEPEEVYWSRGVMDDSNAVYQLAFSFLKTSPS